jgi:carbamoyl-phosphate synthase large subunit
MLNVQLALKDDRFYVIEANPRASRTVPFVSKATAVPLAKAGARIMLGATIAGLRAEGLLPEAGDGARLRPGGPRAVKGVVLPFHRFRSRGGDGIDSALGPEMKSTGEVMGIGADFDTAMAKAQLAAGNAPPLSGRLHFSAAREHLTRVVPALRTLRGLGFEVVADGRTAELLAEAGFAADQTVTGDGAAEVAEMVRAHEIDLVVSLAAHGADRDTDRAARTAAAQFSVPCVTTGSGLLATVRAIRARSRIEFAVRSLQDTHVQLRKHAHQNQPD